MRELTFFTSNQTKLAHARYIAELWPVRIKGFRQRTYHANYFEPRGSSRDELLKASYRSALEQCEKAGLSIDNHPFILEDTSVRIDALSTAENEVPGLDIKYWMEGKTFEQVDAELTARGGDRRVTVRSDVLLHIPRHLKKAWNTTEDYLVFVGAQTGTIVESEHDFKSNLVSPWLDNKTFNKWFQPDGYLQPFGSLEIADADKVDFRRKSFDQLFAFLDERNFFIRDDQQFELQLEDGSSFMLCGYTCAGKTAASQYLSQKYGFLHIEASDFMYLNYYYRHGFQGDVPIGDFAEQALREKPHIAAEKVVDYAIENVMTPVVISGFRSPREISFAQDRLAREGKKFRTVFVDATAEDRYARMNARMRPGDNISPQKFADRDEQQRRMGLDDIADDDDVEKIGNFDTLPNYLQAVGRMVGAAKWDEIDLETSIRNLSELAEIKLEDAVLIALLTVWKETEARPFFTTTAIAGLIGGIFPRHLRKHKDNVSRYFNQDYYAYYEISADSETRVRMYRLSNTGYGKSVMVLRQLKRQFEGH